MIIVKQPFHFSCTALSLVWVDVFIMVIIEIAAQFQMVRESP
jgi:hypothetical protein